MHFNVQSIGHLVVLKVKVTAINSQHQSLFVFHNELWGRFWPNGTFMIHLLKKFKSKPKAGYKGVAELKTGS